tara:strand:- start:4089 stop:5768 length:1680 start_codon:yes stop_codon:yes gene_type:complete
MNLESLLNRRPTLLESTTRLTSLVLKYNRQEIEAKSLLLKKRKETSKQRIKTFRNIQADANQKDNTNSLLSGGLATGGVLSILRGKKTANNIRPFSRSIKPGRLSGLSRISKGSVITNTLFAGLDFANRKSAGQTNLQAGLGAGGGAAGGIAGAAIGQALIPIPVVGALIGGFVGANIGSGLADRASGVTGGNFRRLQLERETVRQSQRTEFTEGLDRFDSALDKFKKYDDDLEAFILRSTGNDNDQAFLPVIPKRGGGGATQAQIDAAYQKGIGVGIGGLALTVVGTAVAIKTGGLILGSGALVKLKGLAALALKKTKAKVLLQRLFQGITIPKIFQKPKPNVIPKTPKITPRTLRLEKNYNLKMLRNALKRSSGKDQAERLDILQKARQVLVTMRQGVSSRAGGELTKGNRANFEAIKKTLKAYDKELDVIDRAISFIKSYKNLGLQKAIEGAKRNIRLKDINRRLKKLEELKSKIEGPSDKPRVGRFRKGRVIDKKGNPKVNFNKNKSVNTSTIIKEGDNFIAMNLPSNPTIIEGDNFDPYISSLNTIKAYSEQTV